MPGYQNYSALSAGRKWLMFPGTGEERTGVPVLTGGRMTGVYMQTGEERKRYSRDSRYNEFPPPPQGKIIVPEEFKSHEV